MSNNKLLLSKTSLEFQPTRSNIIWRWWTTKSYNKFCYCRNRRRALWRKHSILLEKWIKQYKLGRIRQVAILNSPIVTSWRTESSNISLVILDKLLYWFPPGNLLEKWIKKYRLGHIRHIAIWISLHHIFL